MDSSMASAILDPEDTKLTSNNHTFPNSISPPPLRSVTNHKAVSATGTECVVCGDTAPKDTLFRRHYSVICCEACKCFFRRTVQMNRDYKCRYGSSCSVGRNPVNVKQVCQACRFNQCLKAGMKIESVKRFPRKPRDHDGGSKKDKPKSSPQKRSKVSKADVAVTTNGTLTTSPLHKTEKTDSDLDLGETDLEHLKFNISSPEAFMYSVLDSAVPQLFNYDSTDSLHEEGLGSPAKVLGRSREDLSRTTSNPNLLKAVNSSLPALVKAGSSGSLAVQTAGGGRGTLKRSGPDFQSTDQAKKQRIEYVLSNVTARKPVGSYPMASPPQPLHSVSSQSSSMVNSPESVAVMDMSAYNSQNTTPYATPLTTPAQTPVQSPLPSPSHAHPAPFHHPTQHPYPSHLEQRSPPGGGPSSQSPGTFIAPSPPTSSLSTMSAISLPGFTQHTNNILLPSQPSTGTIFLNSPSQMPFRVVPVGPAPLLPLVHFTPFSQDRHRGTTIMPSGKSPFAIIPIPSINKAQPDSPPQPYSPMASYHDSDGMRSAPGSARSSPILGKTKSRAALLPEAELEEVLDSLRLRIRSMFKWAKSEVSGFEDLSPLDQKALLRRTVAELVMLGFARGSIAYDDMLLLGSTGKVIRSSNPNSGVATVASVTLQKLVVPLRVLNIDDRELTLLKELVLFNPESNGLRNREVVRQYRKRKHIELMEYTEKSSEEPGRFGELMCLLTPLFEVSTEVTEQLRLEQFVHEGEARIDALLLMSMINGAEETTESVADA